MMSNCEQNVLVGCEGTSICMKERLPTVLQTLPAAMKLVTLKMPLICPVHAHQQTKQHPHGEESSPAVMHIQLLFHRLIRQLVRLYDRDANILHILKQVGFCLPHSTLSSPSHSHPPYHMQVCVVDGDEIFSSTHTPTISSINTSMDILRRILTVRMSAPSLITIARSVRDGYTPRQLHTHIEGGLLNVIRDVYNHTSTLQVVYDPNLMGGKRGRGINTTTPHTSDTNKFPPVWAQVLATIFKHE